MVLNVEVSEEVMKAMGGIPIVMSAPEQVVNRPLGRALLQDINAILTPGGIIVAFELEPEEVRSIKKGNFHFFVHFINVDAIPPFRLIFEREENLGVEKTNGNTIRFEGDSTPE